MKTEIDRLLAQRVNAPELPTPQLPDVIIDSRGWIRFQNRGPKNKLKERLLVLTRLNDIERTCLYFYLGKQTLAELNTELMTKHGKKISKIEFTSNVDRSKIIIKDFLDGRNGIIIRNEEH